MLEIIEDLLQILVIRTGVLEIIPTTAVKESSWDITLDPAAAAQGHST